MSDFFIIFYVTFDPMRAPDASVPCESALRGDRRRQDEKNGCCNFLDGGFTHLWVNFFLVM